MRVTIVILLAGLYFAPPATAADCDPGSIKISAPSLSGGDENDFLDRFRTAYRKVCTWWGAGWDKDIRIDIEDSRGPSMALIPGWRGERGTMILRTFIVRQSRSAITHEIVHLIAPNGNRFLAEGLAVYAHEYLGGQAAYPNSGRDLHRAARELADPETVLMLAEFATPKRLLTSVLDQKDAYLIAGSFVRFMIETYGMEKFRALYALTPMVPRSRDAGGTPAVWNRVYGKPLRALAVEWKARIAG